MNARDDSSAGEKRRIDLEAAAWLVKHDRGFTAAEQDAFFQWLAADPRHGEWMLHHRESWRALDRLAQWRPEHSTEPNPDLLARPRPRLRGRRALMLAAAASMAALLSGVWINRAYFAGRSASPVAAGYERRTLEDGSVVELNRGAAIDVRFTANERRVTLLRGEALFSVAKNPMRPFIVHARNIDVRAVGTAFDVQLNDRAVEVLVSEGKVQVERVAADARKRPDDEPLHLEASDHAIVPLASDVLPQVTRVTPAQVARTLAWQPQLLDFSAEPLSAVVTEFNRRNRVQIVLADPELATLPIVASIRSDNVEGLVRLLAASAHVRAEERGPELIILHRQ